MITTTSPTRRAEAIHELCATLVGTVRVLKSVRTNLPPGVPGLEQGAVPLLFSVAQAESRISVLAGACGIDQSTASRYATQLAALGLVEKHTDPDDRRAQVLALTDAGRALVAQIGDERRAFVAELLSDWDVDDIETFDRHLRRLAEAVQDRRQGCPAPTTSQELT